MNHYVSVCTVTSNNRVRLDWTGVRDLASVVRIRLLREKSNERPTASVGTALTALICRYYNTVTAKQSSPIFLFLFHLTRSAAAADGELSNLQQR